MADDDINLLEKQLEAERLKTKIAHERDAQLSVEYERRRQYEDERAESWSRRVSKWGRGALFAIGLSISSLGVTDAVLPDDAAVLAKYPTYVTTLTCHEGDPMKMIAGGSAIMVPGLAGKRKSKATKVGARKS